MLGADTQANPDYYSVREIAQRLGVSETTVRSWIQSGSLTAVRIGKLYKVKVSDFGEWLGRRQVAS